VAVGAGRCSGEVTAAVRRLWRDWAVRRFGRIAAALSLNRFGASAVCGRAFHSEARTPRLEVFRAVLMRTTRSIAVVIAVVLSACAAEQRDPLTPRAPTLKEQSLLLKIGMSEQEVTKLLGLPSKAEVGRCGENTATPWTCKTWTSGSAPFYALQAFFRENAGEWQLASWNVAL
jgi:hypothetical protein